MYAARSAQANTTYLFVSLSLPGGVHDKVNMMVPDRIVLVGQEQAIGTSAPPQEILIENKVLPQDPGYIRVIIMFVFFIYINSIKLIFTFFQLFEIFVQAYIL